MKTIFKRKILSLLLITAIAIIFTTCKKDKECKAIITVKKLSDTLIVVPQAEVEIHKSDVYARGVSDGNGQFHYTFTLEAILDVDAILRIPADSVNPADSLTGYSIIRLIPGKTAYKTVFVD